MQLRKVYLKGAAALAAVAALLAIATVLQGDFGETEGKIFATIAATFVAGSAAIAGIACLAQGSRWLGHAGVVLPIMERASAADAQPAESASSARLAASASSPSVWQASASSGSATTRRRWRRRVGPPAPVLTPKPGSGHG